MDNQLPIQINPTSEGNLLPKSTIITPGTPATDELSTKDDSRDDNSSEVSDSESSDVSTDSEESNNMQEQKYQVGTTKCDSVQYYLVAVLAITTACFYYFS